ncbi:unnamed protein product [Prunus armeniaca]
MAGIRGFRPGNWVVQVRGFEGNRSRPVLSEGVAGRGGGSTGAGWWGFAHRGRIGTERECGVESDKSDFYPNSFQNIYSFATELVLVAKSLLQLRFKPTACLRIHLSTTDPKIPVIAPNSSRGRKRRKYPYPKGALEQRLKRYELEGFAKGHEFT